MSSNQFLIDGYTRHQIFLQRFSSQEVNRLTPVIEKLYQDVSNRLDDNLTAYQTGRLLAIRAELDDLIRAGMSEWSEQLRDTLEEFYQYEFDFNDRILTEAIDVDALRPAPEQVRAPSYALAQVMTLISGDSTRDLSVDDIIRQFGDKKAEQINNAIAAGFISGTPHNEVVKQISGLSGRAKQQAGAVVRTAVNQLSDHAMHQASLANQDVLQGEEWVATLDGRTSPVCRDRDSDGEIYPIDSGPRPPAHFACRSVRVPVVADDFKIPGLEGERASVGGPVSAQVTYNGWLGRQPARVQDEILGPTRSALYRRGGLNVDQFVDDRGIQYTLDQLKALEPLAFERANID